MTSLLVSVAFAVLAVTAPPAPAAKDIDAQCRVPAAHARAAEQRPRVFADVSATVLPKPREGQWREFDTEADLRAFAERERAPNTEAVVSRGDKGVTLVSMYFQGPTSDWAHVVDYCYLASGLLARVRGTFNSYVAAAASTSTSTSGIRRRRTIYFDGGGALLRSTTQVSDLATDKPLPDATFTDEDDPLYPALRALPFSTLLAPPAEVSEAGPSPARTVKEHLPAVRACYTKALGRAAPRSAGRIVARFTIDTQGAVASFAWDEDRIGNHAFATCARRVIEALRFPPPGAGPTSVSFPFVFENGEEQAVGRP